MEPPTDPWRELKIWYIVNAFCVFGMVACVVGVAILRDLTMGVPIYVPKLLWITVCVGIVCGVMWKLSATSSYCCPRCHHRFFGWKPITWTRFLRKFDVFLARLARGPIRRKKKRSWRECRTCGLPIFARIRYYNPEDTVKL